MQSDILPSLHHLWFMVKLIARPPMCEGMRHFTAFPWRLNRQCQPFMVVDFIECTWQLLDWPAKLNNIANLIPRGANVMFVSPHFALTFLLTTTRWYLLECECYYYYLVIYASIWSMVCVGGGPWYAYAVSYISCPLDPLFFTLRRLLEASLPKWQLFYPKRHQTINSYIYAWLLVVFPKPHSYANIVCSLGSRMISSHMPLRSSQIFHRTTRKENFVST